VVGVVVPEVVGGSVVRAVELGLGLRSKLGVVADSCVGSSIGCGLRCGCTPHPASSATAAATAAIDRWGLTGRPPVAR
jgi:hypothetical protein